MCRADIRQAKDTNLFLSHRASSISSNGTVPPFSQINLYNLGLLFYSQAPKGAEMTEKEILLKQFDTIRSWTLACVGDFTEGEAQKVAEPIRTSLVWTLGHLAVIDNVLLKHFFGQSALDENFVPKFKTGSDPLGVGGTTKDEVLKKMFAVRKKLRGKLAKIRPADLNKKPNEKSEFYKNLREALCTTSLHEGYHTGKIGTLRRFLGKPALFG
jgi:DinB family protein